jgi:acetamidase/formamidase
MPVPIFVRTGAAPGDVLEIRIQAIDYLHPFGVNAFSPGGGVLPDEFPYATSQADSLESWCGLVSRLRRACRLPLARSLFGSFGVAPPAAGRAPISSRPPLLPDGTAAICG